MTTVPHNGNGHRRRQIVRRVKAEEGTCALCDQPVDKTLTMTMGAHGPKCSDGSCAGCQPHPMRGEVDEDIPRARGGSPYERSNTHLMHRRCNQFKGALTLKEARARFRGQAVSTPSRPIITASPIW